MVIHYFEIVGSFKYDLEYADYYAILLKTK